MRSHGRTSASRRRSGGTPPGPSGTITRVQYGSGTIGDNATSLALLLDTPAKGNNLLIAAWGVDKSAGVFTPPPDWLPLAAQDGASTSLLVAFKVASGGETSAIASWSAPSVNGATGIIVEYAGLRTTGPTGPSHLPPYSNTGRTSMLLDPPHAEADGGALAFFSIDSLTAPNDTTDFRPAAPGFTWVDTIVRPNSPGGGATALCERLDVTAGEDISTTFTWTRQDQVAGFMQLVNRI